MIKKIILSITFLSVILYPGKSQVTTKPEFISKNYNGEIEITFDPTQGNGGMIEASECYAHTGLITSESKNNEDWKYAPEKWLDKNPKYKMTKDGGVWKLKITPNIHEYYECPESEEIKKLAFVFNDGIEGGKEGKTADGKDIFIDIVENGLNVKFNTPDGNRLVEINNSVDFNVSASENASISLFMNGTEMQTSTGTNLNYKHTFAQSGDYEFIAEATIGNQSVFDTVTICIAKTTENEKRPEYIQAGINYYDNDHTKATLMLYAKNKSQQPARNVFVIGDFNKWKFSTEYQMKKDGSSGYFWLDITGLEKDREYCFQYAVQRADGSMVQISDPFTEKTVDSDDKYIWDEIYPDKLPYPALANGPAAVIQTGKEKYAWSDATLSFKRPNKNNLVIYELWVHDFSPFRSINGVTARLDYLKNLGINAIELMPVCEFEGNISWGYNPTHYFALDKNYGTPDDFKRFVDEAHKRGIAVILDMVFNHCTGIAPLNKLFPLKENPYFNITAPHTYKIFEDFNHEFDLTFDHFRRVLNYWLEEYKIDGYRMDVSHGLCGTTCNDIKGIINRYYNEGVKTISEDAYFILEHWPWEDGRDGNAERNDLVNMGMLCWENTNNAYSQTAMGWLTDGDGFNEATKDGFVSYTCSHDEERNFYKAEKWGAEQINKDSTIRINRVAANIAMCVMLNGPQMIWQYDELGYDKSIELNGRTGTKPMPEKLGWFTSALRMNQYQTIGRIIHLRTNVYPELFAGNPYSSNVAGGKALRSIIWGDKETEKRIFVISNLSAKDNLNYTLPEGNSWYDYLAGSNTGMAEGTSLTIKAGEVKVWTTEKISLPDIPNTYHFTDWVKNETIHSNDECTVYPTIARDIINISTDNDFERIDIYSLMGQKMISRGNVRNINISGLKQGIYLVIVTYKDHQETVKIIKE